ncbi:MAG: type II secretion system protein GspG [Rhodospirillaceae bacterium]|nr:type II secretion system protein GspG [Rhodospirillaceae bacterium]
MTIRLTDKQGGFTLLELLIVLAILALIAGIAAPQLMNVLGSAKTNTAGIQIEKLSTALDIYRLDMGRYPDNKIGLGALVEKPQAATTWNGPYVKKADQLLDPWGNPFYYRHPGQHGPFDLYSFGADGREGGDGEERDVKSW